ncbi:hypothetical protein DEU56DRAFT_906601 [Suillus clintonianus]|uniref:uncharacterized protein n=1 Tax=Suillus clintonianus TaxID=1904413 RepID=UPI001B879907|nr:uncharacterized protein DEU56DRAFT_906601 [Suillus clintonianus]KAG2155389.1 hypothetical protein DEU56DRAFT_906601 [Suillus clintonianus]
MLLATPVNYHYRRPLSFALDPYLAEQRERSLPLRFEQQLRNHNSIRSLVPEHDHCLNTYLGYPYTTHDHDMLEYELALHRARRQAAIQRANRAILDQAVREREARVREQKYFAALQAHLKEQQVRARRAAEVNSFLAGPEPFFSAFRSFDQPDVTKLPTQPTASTSKAPVQDEPSLEDRLMAEYQSDVRDTLQSIFACLSEGTSTEPPIEHVPVTSAVPETSAKPVTSAKVSSSTPVNLNDEGATSSQKGKGKAKEIPDSDTEEDPSASPAQVASSLSQITSIASRLETLIADFQFPAELDFSPSRSPSPAYSALDTADAFALTYAATNAPLRAQEHALSLLLGDLDNVPSFGSHVVRDARRAVVARVEQALEELERGVEERRGRARARKAVPVPVEQPARSTQTHVHPPEPENLTSADLAPNQVTAVDEVPTKVFVPAVPVEALAPAASSPIEAIADPAVFETSIEAPAASIEIATASVAEPSLPSSASLPTASSEVSETLTAQLSVPVEEGYEEPLVDEVSTSTVSEDTSVEDAIIIEDTDTPIHADLTHSSSATRPTPPAIDTSDSLSQNTIGISVPASIPNSTTLTHADADSSADTTNISASFPPAAASSILTPEQTPSQVNVPESDSESYSTMESPAPSSPVSEAEVDTFLLLGDELVEKEWCNVEA